MKVGFLSPSLSRIAGGIYEVERELALALDTIPGVQVTAYGVRDDETDKDIPSWRHIPLRIGALKGPQGFGYSPELRDIFARADEDIVHLHVLWMYTSVIALKWRRRTGRPYVTTVNGMLEPWARNNAVLKKRAAAFFYERAALRNVGCLHVTAGELESARSFGVKGPFCVIPNGVSLPEPIADLQAALPESVRTVTAAGGKLLLFLGRLHPKKNLAATLDAFIALAPSHPDWYFVAAGWGAEDYIETLRARVAAAGMADRVLFPGPVYGAEKAALLAASQAFVLASHSEGFPIGLLEAFANYLPVAMTTMCNLPAGFEVGAAVKVDIDAGSIAEGLRYLLDMTDAERRAMGQRGRTLVEARYTWDGVAQQMHQVYGWLLGGGPVPDCVVF